MARSSISGFPEWSPAERIVEQRALDAMRRVFELHGFASIETRAIQPIERLLAKGETSKEIYTLARLQDAESSRPAELGLRFDLTVPLASYVAERAGTLDFPFKPYQIQKVWRGERPQAGRFREFTQADVDVIGDGALPFHYEVELPLVMAEALAALPIGEVTIRANNRKLTEGFYRGLGLADPAAVLRILDKLAKIGPDGVTAALVAEAGLSEAQAAACLELAELRGGLDALDAVERLAARHGAAGEMFAEGLAELRRLVQAAGERLPGALIADLSVARGLDYYTGSVYETTLRGHEAVGSVCSGGRYEKLVTDGKRTFPGVGMSIGVSRLLSLLFADGAVTASRSVPTAVLVAVNDEEHRGDADRIAQALRERGIPADTSPSAAKFGKQIRFAERRGIPYVWFPAADGGPGSVKDIRSGDQVEADPGAWPIPDADRHPTLTTPSDPPA